MIAFSAAPPKHARRLPGLVWKLLSLQFLMSATHFMVAPILAFHLAERVGLDAAELGTVLSIHLLSARLLPIVTGPAADRQDARVLITMGLLVRALGLLGFAVLTDWVPLSAAALATGLGTAAYESAVYGAFSRQPQETTSRIFVLNNQALNLGVIVGPAMGAGLLAIDASYVFIASAVIFTLLALGTTTLAELPAPTARRLPFRSSLAAVRSHGTFLSFAFVALPWWFLLSQLYVIFPIYAIRLSGVAAAASLVFLANGLAGTVFVVVGLYAFKRLPGYTIIVLCYAGLLAAYLLVVATDGMTWFLIFVCLYTLAETLILPAIRSVTALLATRGHESTFQGAQNLGWAIAGALGNYVGGWIVLDRIWLEAWLLFAGVSALGLALALWFRRRNRDVLANAGSQGAPPRTAHCRDTR